MTSLLINFGSIVTILFSTELGSITSAKYFTAGLTVMNLVILIGMPIIGAITDVKNLTKTFFSVFSFLGALLVISFAFVSENEWLFALILYGIALFCFSAAIVLYDKILIYISSSHNISKVSGFGYSVGYLGGGTLFVINAFMVMNPSFFGLENSAAAIKLSFVTVGIWWIIFTLPLFINYEQPKIQEGKIIDAFKQIYKTFIDITNQKNIVLFLIAFFLYIDGVHTVMSLAAIFANSIGIGQESIILALILVQFVAAPATFIWSYVSTRYGDKMVIYMSILIYIGVIFYSMGLDNAYEFYFMAGLIGSVQGGIQASSRSLFAKIIPEDKSGEFFGFYNTFGRAGSVIGPLLVNVFLVAFNNIRIALIPLIVLFILGALFLKFVKE